MGYTKEMKKFVCTWALGSAFTITILVVYTFTHPGEDPVPAASASTSSSSSSSCSCVNLTDVADVAASAVMAGLLFLSAPQATAAMLALVLPAGPRRLALAFAAHAANTASQFLVATLFGLLLVLAPETGTKTNSHLMGAMVFICCGVLDVLGFLALLSGEEADDEAEAE